MIYLDLFLGFLKVGCLAFGGAYGAIPLIRDVVLSYGWISEDTLTNMIAVSESTPGPIMVNIATYVGSNQAGFWGAALATSAVVLPSFLIILLIMVLWKNLWKNVYVQALLRGIKPAICGIILATGIYMLLNPVLHLKEGIRLDIPSIGIALVMAGWLFLPPRFQKKKPSPILVIIGSAVLGIVFFYLA